MHAWIFYTAVNCFSVIWCWMPQICSDKDLWSAVPCCLFKAPSLCEGCDDWECSQTPQVAEGLWCSPGRDPVGGERGRLFTPHALPPPRAGPASSPPCSPHAAHSAGGAARVSSHTAHARTPTAGGDGKFQPHAHPHTHTRRARAWPGHERADRAGDYHQIHGQKAQEHAEELQEDILSLPGSEPRVSTSSLLRASTSRFLLLSCLLPSQQSHCDVKMSSWEFNVNFLSDYLNNSQVFFFLYKTFYSLKITQCAL